MTEVSGLPVHGYRPTQSQENIDLVNEGKVLEERVMRWLDKIVKVAMDREEGQSVEKVDMSGVTMGRRYIQTGFMWAARGVFCPKRVDLPEDGELK